MTIPGCSFNNKSGFIVIHGEAFCDVTHSLNKPFIIRDKNTQTTVLGTSFNLSSTDSTSLTLVDGEVSFKDIKNDLKEVIITPGNTVTYNNKQIKNFTTQNINFDSWKTGILSFNNSDIRYVEQILKNHYKTDINFNLNNNVSCLFTGDFDNESIQDILEVMKFTYDLNYTQTDNTYSITINNCN